MQAGVGTATGSPTRSSRPVPRSTRNAATAPANWLTTYISRSVGSSTRSHGSALIPGCSVTRWVVTRRSRRPESSTAKVTTLSCPRLAA